MEEERKKRVAVFRFGVIADFVGTRQLDRGETERLIRDKCARKWQIPFSSRTRISETSIKEWTARYKLSGNKLESLYPQERSDKGNDLWQADVMHGPYVESEGKQRKTYLIAFIDDMSRLVPHAEFYLHERLECFLEALRKALLHAKPYQPEGKGKIERWFRTVRGQFLSTFKVTTLQALNEAFRSWVLRYHETVHNSTGEAPLRRFADKIECVRAAPKDLQDYFRKVAKRTVAKDRTISLGGRLYEAPVALIGKRVTLLYHEHDGARVEVTFGGKTHGFVSKLDVNVNCRVKRGKDAFELDTKNNPGRYSGGNLFGRKDKEDRQ